MDLINNIDCFVLPIDTMMILDAKLLYITNQTFFKFCDVADIAVPLLMIKFTAFFLIWHL